MYKVHICTQYWTPIHVLTLFMYKPQDTYMYTIQDINPGIKLWYDVPYFCTLYIILYINLGCYLVHRIMYLIYITYVCSTEYCTSIQVYIYLLIVLHITHVHTTYTITLYRVLKINSGDYLVHVTIHNYVHSTQYCILIQVVILYMVLYITYLHSTYYTVLYINSVGYLVHGVIQYFCTQYTLLYINSGCYVVHGIINYLCTYRTQYCTLTQDVIQYMVVYIQYKLCTIVYNTVHQFRCSYLVHGIMYVTYVCFSNI